ncbi:hypothetical protein Tco_1004327 [Tanacetum coccineum]|uniref:Uncharacterized protein n=1 Tax=Tanacetum coccineum TaxID=301880 RepID=A0ABQ5FC78_9ASTR
MEECHKMLTDQIDWANPEGDQVMIDISKPLPLSGPPGHVTIQTQFFFNKDLDYLRYGSKGSGQALSISKMKAARYHDFGFVLLVPKHMWIDDVCTYDISASYGISHADHQEYTIAKKDFKNLYPSDFENLNLLLFQGHLNHLPSSDIRMLSTAVKLYQKQLNLPKPGWDATGFEFKHDYTIIDSPRVVVFPVSNNERKIMRFNEIYKFSDGTLTYIIEALDYKVNEYKVNQLNPEGSSRIWNALLVDGFTILTTDFFRERNDLFIPFIRSVLTVFGGSSKDVDGDTLFQWSLFYNRMFILSNDLMKAQMSPAQDGKRPKVDDQRSDLADDLKKAQDHISSTITSHKTKITTSMYKISHEESKTTS